MKYKCPVCEEKNPKIAWTDTHGVAQCFTCGTPVRVLHYDDDGELQKDAPAECAVHPEFIAVLKRFRAETGCMVFSGFSFLGGRELASPRDKAEWDAWMEKNRDEVDRARAMCEGAQFLG